MRVLRSLLVILASLLVARPGAAQRAPTRADSVRALAGLLPAIERSLDAYGGKGSIRGRVVVVQDSLQLLALRGSAESVGFRLVLDRDAPIRCAPMPGNAARSTVPIGFWLFVEFRAFAADSAIVDVNAMCAHYYESGPGDPYVSGQKVLLRLRGIRWEIEQVIIEWVT